MKQNLALIVAVLAVLAGVVIGVGHWSASLIAKGDAQGAERVQAAWGDAERQRALQLVEDQEKARRDEAEQRRNSEEIAHAQAQREADLQARLDRSAAARRGLLDTIAAIDARNAELSKAAGDPRLAGIAEEARVARELLGRCAGRYGAVAAAADALRDQVISLQAFATTVCKAGAHDDR
ncbi:hypothetical protein CKO44_15955 [Rubrivivax gelatinosus]|uniref:hypothetical protein n=1 Tax=Rubrivivax gelatinosus TaxID=28068 RepID=UPI0019049E23|nr:hypothetical protein [Rubrivivax gelatinosus]MBK1614963.1 hypothetical protein [Rubrivivax gelatinosus]